MNSENQQEVSEIGKRGKKDEALWLMSFSDMSLVLLCFFVLLLSTMKPNPQKLDHIKEGMSNTKPKKKPKMKELAQKIDKVIKEQKLSKSANVTYEEGGVVIEFRDQIVFSSGSPRANKSYEKVTDEVLSIVAKGDKNMSVTIEGHSDDTPTNSSGPYKSNWELSAARGFTVLRQFVKLGVEEQRMQVIALADTKPNVSVEGLKGKDLQEARAKNRRVLIRLK